MGGSGKCQYLKWMWYAIGDRIASKQDLQMVVQSKAWIRISMETTPLGTKAKIGFNPKTEMVPKTIVWFRIYNLSSEFWGDGVLESIGKKLGNFLYLDNPLEDQTMGTYFKICVSVSLEAKIPSEIELMSEVGNWTQLIDREDKLDLCPHCRSLTHTPVSCNFKIPLDDNHKIEQSFLGSVKERSSGFHLLT
ncbi:hypothetical protein SUGI_0770890 [Cryptomeria japonica]|nr:hypothetical protein SUGI_0770890 [Cryptomeria japonica]